MLHVSCCRFVLLLHSSQKNYIIFVFGINLPTIYISVTRKHFWGEAISRNLHIKDSFVIRRITWKNRLGIISLENLISVTQNNVFGINFAVISGWSVHHEGETHPKIHPPK